MSEALAPRVETTFADGIGQIALDNPARRNALTGAMWKELAAGARGLAARSDLRAVMIRGAGREAFTSGADISEFGAERRSAAQAETYGQAVQEALDAVEALTVPVAALIHGYCIGGGVALALACDLRFLDDAAQIAVPAARLGIGYSPLWIKRLVDATGPGFAAELLFLGARRDAGRALAAGFANAVLPADALDGHVEDRLRDLAANAPLTLRAAKAAIRQSLACDRDRDWETACALARQCASSQDYLEAIEAFSRREAPVFLGR